MMRNILALITVLSLSAGMVGTWQNAAFAKRHKTYNASVSKSHGKGERSYTCRGEAKQDSVTKGALYGAGAGLLVTGNPLGAVLGSGTGMLVQHSQNNAACGR
jgi:hypothetical protein